MDMTISPAAALCAFAMVPLTAAQAMPAPASSAAATPLPGIIVPGGPPPKVAASYPADGSEVPAGTLVLKVVFDQPMTAGGWSYARSPSEAFPHCLAKPRLLADRRTFVLLCSVLPHQTYAVEINTPLDFKSEIGRSAKPTLIRFSTSDTGPRDIQDALHMAGLTDADDPVMTWRDDGAGVSSASPPEEADGPGG